MPFEPIATWDPNPNWMQVHQTEHGERMEFGVGIFLPAYKVLEDQAEHLIINNSPLIDRVPSAEWLERIKDIPGELRIIGERSGGCKLRYRIEGQVAGDIDGRFYSSSFMRPEMALAWIVAAQEQHELELRETMIEFTGGLA